MSETFTARRLPVNTGPAAWNAILGPQPPARVLDGDETVDFAVIGAGFAGLSAARRLTQLVPGARIAVLDAGRVGEGASGRNSGFMIDLPHELTSEDYAGQKVVEDRKIIELNRAAIAFARAAVEDYGINPAYFDPIGKVNGATSDKAHQKNVSYAAHLKTLGEDCEMLDAQYMKELTGSAFYRSGLYTPGTAMLQPAGYVRGLAAGLSNSVELYEMSPVTSFARNGSGWTVTTGKGRLQCEKLILANNGHLESFGFKRGRLMHIFLYACMTRELRADELARLGGRPRWGITPSDPMGTTMRRIDAALGGNRIVTRTCASFLPEMRVSQAQVDRAAAVMRRKFDARFPKLSGVGMEYAWSGHLCLSYNNVSVAKELEHGLFSACCQNGLGTARGTLTGIAAAETAAGDPGPIAAYFEAQPEPDRLPPPPISTIGANLYLRWREWRAGGD